MKKFLLSFILFLRVTAFLQAEPEQLKIEIVSTLPHDKKAFTQGLVIVGDALYESTGQYGESSVRKIDIRDGKILENYKLAPRFFGEGITYVNGQLIQLTWQEEMAFVYDLNPIHLSHRIDYKGQGWGLCNDGNSLLMTNGSADLLECNTRTFQLENKKVVRLNGKNLYRLNDIICLKNDVFANVWMKNQIFRINKKSGEVTAIIDGSNLLTSEEKGALTDEAILNGIAYREETNTFFITGKYWPKIFEVRFVPK